MDGCCFGRGYVCEWSFQNQDSQDWDEGASFSPLPRPSPIKGEGGLVVGVVLFSPHSVDTALKPV